MLIHRQQQIHVLAHRQVRPEEQPLLAQQIVRTDVTQQLDHRLSTGLRPFAARVGQTLQRSQLHILLAALLTVRIDRLLDLHTAAQQQLQQRDRALAHRDSLTHIRVAVEVAGLHRGDHQEQPLRIGIAFLRKILRDLFQPADRTPLHTVLRIQRFEIGLLEPRPQHAVQRGDSKLRAGLRPLHRLLAASDTPVDTRRLQRLVMHELARARLRRPTEHRHQLADVRRPQPGTLPQLVRVIRTGSLHLGIDRRIADRILVLTQTATDVLELRRDHHPQLGDLRNTGLVRHGEQTLGVQIPHLLREIHTGVRHTGLNVQDELVDRLLEPGGVILQRLRALILRPALHIPAHQPGLQPCQSLLDDQRRRRTVRLRRERLDVRLLAAGRVDVHLPLARPTVSRDQLPRVIHQIRGDLPLIPHVLQATAQILTLLLRHVQVELLHQVVTVVVGTQRLQHRLVDAGDPVTVVPGHHLRHPGQHQVVRPAVLRRMPRQQQLDHRLRGLRVDHALVVRQRHPHPVEVGQLLVEPVQDLIARLPVPLLRELAELLHQRALGHHPATTVTFPQQHPGRTNLHLEIRHILRTDLGVALRSLQLDLQRLPVLRRQRRVLQLLPQRRDLRVVVPQLVRLLLQLLLDSISLLAETRHHLAERHRHRVRAMLVGLRVDLRPATLTRLRIDRTRNPRQIRLLAERLQRIPTHIVRSLQLGITNLRAEHPHPSLGQRRISTAPAHLLRSDLTQPGSPRILIRRRHIQRLDRPLRHPLLLLLPLLRIQVLTGALVEPHPPALIQHRVPRRAVVQPARPHTKTSRATVRRSLHRLTELRLPAETRLIQIRLRELLVTLRRRIQQRRLPLATTTQLVRGPVHVVRRDDRPIPITPRQLTGTQLHRTLTHHLARHELLKRPLRIDDLAIRIPDEPGRRHHLVIGIPHTLRRTDLPRPLVQPQTRSLTRMPHRPRHQPRNRSLNRVDPDTPVRSQPLPVVLVLVELSGRLIEIRIGQHITTDTTSSTRTHHARVRGPAHRSTELAGGIRERTRQIQRLPLHRRVRIAVLIRAVPVHLTIATIPIQQLLRAAHRVRHRRQEPHRQRRPLLHRMPIREDLLDTRELLSDLLLPGVRPRRHVDQLVLVQLRAEQTSDTADNPTDDRTGSTSHHRTRTSDRTRSTTDDRAQPGTSDHTTKHTAGSDDRIPDTLTDRLRILLDILLILMSRRRILRKIRPLPLLGLDLLRIPGLITLLEQLGIPTARHVQRPQQPVRLVITHRVIHVLPHLAVDEHIANPELPIRVIPQRDPSLLLARILELLKVDALVVLLRSPLPVLLILREELLVERRVPPVVHTHRVLARVPVPGQLPGILRHPRTLLRIPRRVLLQLIRIAVSRLLHPGRGSRTPRHIIERAVDLAPIRHQESSHETTDLPTTLAPTTPETPLSQGSHASPAKTPTESHHQTQPPWEKPTATPNRHRKQGAKPPNPRESRVAGVAAESFVGPSKRKYRN